MKQHIHLAAMVLRDGRLWLVREHPAAPWELPGGPLPPENDDVDAEMEAILQRLGIDAPAIEEDFVETIHLPHEGGHLLYNVYAPSEWSGEPAAEAGLGSGWFAVDELDAIEMQPPVRNAILIALGLKPPTDRSAEFVATLNEQFGASFSLAGGSSNRTGVVEERLGRDFPMLAAAILPGLSSASAGLDPRTRNLAAVAVLVALGRRELLAEQLNDALAAGAVPQELVSIFQLAGAYAGFPTAVAAWPELDRAITAHGSKPQGSAR
jgi:4-carboxymuconolactone decarboxylase